MTGKSVQNDFQWKSMFHQYYATISANLIMLSQGCITGWFSPAVPLLMSDDTPLASGPITMEQLSWIGSINCIGAIFGTFTFGFITSMIGCKRAMTFLAIPATIFWISIIFADHIHYILLSRVIMGWTNGGIQATIVLYVAEIANDNIRGKLGSMAQLARNVGILIAYITGAFISYAYIPYVFICIPIVFLINFVLLPNTPQYLLRKQKIEKAEKSLRYYKGCEEPTKQEELALEYEFDRLRSIAEKHDSNEKIRFKDFCERKALKGLLIGIVMPFLSQASGCFTIITYAVTIFEESGSNMSAYMASIILGVVQIIGTLFTTQLADTLGRKIVLIVTLFGCSMGLFALASYLYLDKHNYDVSGYSWVPVVSLAFVIFMASVGIVPLFSVCTVENLPSQIRTVGLTVSNVSLNVSTFVCAKFFPILMGIIQMHGCMMIFAVLTMFGVLFVHYVLEETSGKSMDELDSKEPTKKVENQSQVRMT